MVLIKALWERSSPAAFFTMTGLPAPAFDERSASQILSGPYKYFDYLDGRVMKISLNTDDVDPSLYDRDLGKGAFAEVVRKLRLQYP